MQLLHACSTWIRRNGRLPAPDQRGNKMNSAKNSGKIMPSQSTIDSTRIAGVWTGTQAYVLAAFCLLLGVALGYLFRGSASPAAAQAATSTLTADSQSGKGVHPPEADPNAQAALAQAAAPLLDAVSKDPNDYDSLVQ